MAIAAASKNDAIASLPADVGHDLVHTLGIIFIPKDVEEFFPSLQYDILIVLMICMYICTLAEKVKMVSLVRNILKICPVCLLEFGQ